LTNIRAIDRAGVAAWLQADNPAVGYQALVSLPPERRSELETSAKALVARNPANQCSIRLAVNISFDGSFLVNDASQTGKGEGKHDHAPLLDGLAGDALLPASSLRGALRSQAEKILRTMKGPLAACYADGQGPRPPCGPVRRKRDLERLCPVCKVFGASGWRSPVQVSDFTRLPAMPPASGQFVTQEFLAIDRFTGGGAAHLKFNAQSAYRPRLAGTLAVDLEALDRAGAGPWALLLVALVLRDLKEGDIPLGFGVAKGYGACACEFRIAHMPVVDQLPPMFLQAVRKESIGQRDLDSLGASFTAGPALECALIGWFEELKASVGGKAQ
jgi:CRISPR/Cas system CSM-associated protein Csm3 (group 7 of RAMP superfamily)